MVGRKLTAHITVLSEDADGDIALSTRAWAQREPLAKYVVIPAAGHASNLDNPEAFTAALLAFLHRTFPPGDETEPASRPATTRGTGHPPRH